MGKICELCLCPAGGAPLHKKCAVLSRDRYRDYRKLMRAGIPLWYGALRNAKRDEKRWKAYLGWENARLMLLGRDADTHVPQTRLKPYPSYREKDIAIQEAVRSQIELGPHLGEEPYHGQADNHPLELDIA